jgi:hypothetical protein
VKPTPVILALAVLACDSSHSPVPNTRSVAVRERLARGSDFGRILRSGLQTRVHVLMSFTEPRKPEDVISAARLHSLTIAGFRRLLTSSGYTLVQGDPSMRRCMSTEGTLKSSQGCVWRMEVADQTVDPAMNRRTSVKRTKPALAFLSCSFWDLISGLEATEPRRRRFVPPLDRLRTGSSSGGSRRNASAPFYLE